MTLNIFHLILCLTNKRCSSLWYEIAICYCQPYRDVAIKQKSWCCCLRTIQWNSNEFSSLLLSMQILIYIFFCRHSSRRIFSNYFFWMNQIKYLSLSNVAGNWAELFALVVMLSCYLKAFYSFCVAKWKIILNVLHQTCGIVSNTYTSTHTYTHHVHMYICSLGIHTQCYRLTTAEWWAHGFKCELWG